MKSNELGYFRKRFFPVYDHEMKKIVPLIIMMGLITYIYGSLRMLKDAYIIPFGGTKAIAKGKLNVLISIFFIKPIYDRVAKRMNPFNRMYLFIVYFTVYFAAFYVWFVLAKPEKLEEPYLASLSRWEYVLQTWPYFMFYIHAEAVGTFMLSVGFWSFLNIITTNEQAKRCYPALSLGSALSTFLAGLIGLLTAPSLHEKYTVEMKSPTLLLFIIGAIIILGGFYYWFVGKVTHDLVGYEVPREVKKKKKKLGFIASIKAFLKSSQTLYILLICMLIGGYNLGINLFEIVTKSFNNVYATLHGYDKTALTIHLGSWQLICIGIASLVIVLFVVAPARKQSWRFNALIVPVTFFLGSIIFFGYIFYIGTERLYQELPLGLMILGIGVIVLVKSSKYVFFDPSTAFVYKQLPADEQLTAQSLGNGVVARSSKGAGSFMNTFWFKNIVPKSAPMFFASWLIGPLVLVNLLGWIYAVSKLDTRCKKMVKENERAIKKLEKQT